ncbi:hypothetical protein [Paludisphaera borealis]|uniref:Uncharacterized protein n=1 Tax=Paludisphaera borealis TaxID=1387353 RepID=A0A1U7CJJ5_9BACT|nr:hypothetical protein [Paludisphaera borealis]APW59053.1 hypothetical protein BSF38_00467 [Paludisphaera borealis]
MKIPDARQRRRNAAAFALRVFVVLSAALFPISQRADAVELDGAVAKAVVKPADGGRNVLDPKAWRPWDLGFQVEGARFVCDNGGDAHARRGLSQHVVLNQKRPAPIVASAWSAAEGVSGTPDPDYALYLDLVYDDGSQVWGQSTPFKTGSHGDQEARVVFVPERPVKELTVSLLFRGHAGKATFRDPKLTVLDTGSSGVVFDGEPVVPRGPSRDGFLVRDVAAAGDFVHIDKQALGLGLEVKRTKEQGGEVFDVTLSDATGRDRAVTLLYTIPVPADGARWLDDLRRSSPATPGTEYMQAKTFHAGANGRMSLYPLGAVTRDGQGFALGLDPDRPAFSRIGYNAGTGELFLAFDVALTPEKNRASLHFRRFGFDPAWGFRAALDAYYRRFPAAFVRRVPKQGLWMPFSKISTIPGWEDFGFRFKEGADETAWDDAHGIITFRYTEPMTWWMPMPPKMPRTIDAAKAEAERLAATGKAEARAWLSSVYHDRDGQYVGRLIEAPWNKGVVWSMNSAPGVAGDLNDFQVKWNPRVRERFYGPNRKGDLDGEYIDSSEGYVTDELDFRRSHFATSEAPLVYSIDDRRPAVFRGTIAFEYARGIARDVHAADKLMMANATPDRLWWLAPMLDVMGTETDWNPQGAWRPMSDADLLYRRALCKGKPFCFLMNTDFDRFGADKVEKYMKRAVAYGMFPGFFSPNAADGAYFTRPELYDRDRPLFRKYLPLCKTIAEAGWEPITLARSSDDHVHVERYGDLGPRYLTVFNDGPEKRSETITLDKPVSGTSRELVGGRNVSWKDGRTTVMLESGDLAILEMP